MFNYNAEKPRFTLAHNRDSRVNLGLLSTIGKVIFATLIFSLTILNQTNASETDTAITKQMLNVSSLPLATVRYLATLKKEKAPRLY